MSYCLGMLLDAGLVFMSDTRTNAGVDNIASFRKTFVFEGQDDRRIVILVAGNLAITQNVVSRLEERLDEASELVKEHIAWALEQQQQKVSENSQLERNKQRLIRIVEKGLPRDA